MGRAVALARNSWRQLTSMRTALVLLFLLAVAAIPGSVLPQRSVNPEQVQGYLLEHRRLGPWLDRLWGFDVFASPWFSAIYVLLFTSLIGCIVPRLRDHARAITAVPPDAPRRLDRLPQHAPGAPYPGAPAEVAAALRAALRRGRPGSALPAAGRWRAVARDHPDGSWTVSAEKGHLKETGNLVFHSALILVLVGVALGSWFGWHGNRLLVTGPENAFCNHIQQFDEYALGPRIDPTGLPDFCLELTEFKAEYRETGQPASFTARVRVDASVGAAGVGPGGAAGAGAPVSGERSRTAAFSVNDPLRLAGANVYLLGHGYAPVLRYTDRYGRAQTTVAPFLPTGDIELTSEGAAKFPDANVNPKTGERDPQLQVGFQGLFLPTVPDKPPFTRSVFPDERAPALVLSAFRGNLGGDTGIPSSVYQLEKRQIANGRLRAIGEPKLLRRGETWRLDDGSKLEFLGTRQWITVTVRHDPGSALVLFSAGLLLGGLMLSLAGRRRRIWFRITAADGGSGGAPSGGAGPGGAGPGGAGPGGAATGGAATGGGGPEAWSPAGGTSVVSAGGLPRGDYPGFAEEFAALVAAIAPATAHRAASAPATAHRGRIE